MAVFEIQGPDGKTYEVDAPDMQSAVRALQSLSGGVGGVSTDSAAVDEFGGKVGAAIDGVHNGMTLGFGDNLAGAKGAIFGQRTGPDGRLSTDYSGTMGERYARERDARRAAMATSERENPLAYGAGNVMGAMAPAATSLPMATGRGLFTTTLRGVGIGGAEGAATGAGNADGENVGESAVAGGILGGIVGGAAPAAVWGGAKARQLVTDPATGLLDLVTKRPSQSKANREVATAFHRSNKTADDVSRALAEAMADGQPDYALMDALGRGGQRAANGIVRGPDGAASREIAEYLENRQLGQPDRVGEFVHDAFGYRGQGSGNTLPMDPNNPVPANTGQVLSGPQRSARQTTEALTAARSNTANAAYDAARKDAGPVDVRGALSIIDSRIGGMKGSNISSDGIDSKLSRYRNRLAADPAPEGEISRELSDFDRVLGVKQDLQDDIGAAVRAGRNNEARELGKLMGELDAALEAASPSYRKANDGFRDASRVISAVDEGADMVKPGRRSVDTTRDFQRMTPDQQRAARIGYGDRLLAPLEANAAPTANRAKPLTSPKRKAEAQEMALNPDQYQRRLSRENDMWETQHKALQGSQTANNVEDIKGAESAAGGLLSAAVEGGNLNLGNAVKQVMATLGPIAKGQTEATRQLVARALLSKDPMAALEPALKQDKTTQMRRRVIEAILRNVARPALD